MNMDKLNKHLNRILTVVVILCAALCLVLSVQVLQKGDVCLFGTRVYHILTGSMEPTIPTGAIVLTRETDFGSLEVGDIITFSSRDPALAGAANTHRIIGTDVDENGRTCLVTRGDNNPIEDQTRVYPEDIKGKVVYYSHMNGFSTFLSFIRTGPGFLTVIVMPLMIVAWCILKDFRRELNKALRAQVEEEMAQERAQLAQAAAAEQSAEVHSSEAQSADETPAQDTQ